MHYIKVYPVEIIEGFAENESYMLMLMDPSSQKYIPIMIGSHEAQSIILASEHTDTKRPMTHELLINIMKEYMLELKHVTIDRFVEGIFYATLHMSDGIMDRNVDCRTSDAVALAAMVNCDIEVAETVFEETCVERDNLMNGYSKPQNTNMSLEELKRRLEEAESNEEYELAAELQKKIEQWTKE